MSDIAYKHDEVEWEGKPCVIIDGKNKMQGVLNTYAQVGDKNAVSQEPMAKLKLEPISSKKSFWTPWMWGEYSSKESPERRGVNVPN